MQRKAVAMFVFVLLGALAVGQAQQAQEEYLDVETVQVKPEKRAEFDLLGRGSQRNWNCSKGRIEGLC